MSELLSLPDSWVNVAFDDAVNMVSDNGIRIKQKDYLSTGSIPVIDQGDSLIGGYTNLEDARITHPLPLIVFGDHTRRFKYVTFHFAVGADGVKLFDPTTLWDKRFFFFQLETIDLENRGYSRHYQYLRKAILVLPPKNEQTRIVEKLEELLTDLNTATNELKTAQKKLTQYRQSLLKAAVEGALTAEWRANNTPSESGGQLLARILKERRARWEQKQLEKFNEQGKMPPKDWQSKYSEPVKPDTTGLLELPDGWVWTCIGQSFHVAVGATPSRKEPTYWNGDIPWVSSGEVRFTHITDTKEKISADGLKNSSTNINPIGSVLLGMIGEGKTRGQVSILDIEAANNQNCAAIWTSETDIPSEYVYYWLWSRYEETRKGSSGNNQPALNKSIVEKIPMPLPPVAELEQLTQFLSIALDGIANQEKFIEHSLKQSAAQRKNILKAAFSGQLVPQDPNDEPASVLLERINESKKAEGTKKKGKAQNPSFSLPTSSLKKEAST